MSKKQKQHQSIVPGHAIAVSVVNNDIKHALQTWKRKVKESDVLATLKTNQEYEKPTSRRRREKSKAVFLQKIRTRDEQ